MKGIFLRIVVGVTLIACTPKAVNGQNRYEATWKSLHGYQCPDWFRDAKFGIFIHWGVYSVPAFGNEWYPRNMYSSESREYKHHLATYGPLTKFGYKDFIPLFRAEKFNANSWIELFSRAGARYVVPVAEHHDGFAMYKTALSKWNALEMGPKRDIIGELAAAAQKQGLIFGVSSHRIEHWWFMNNGRAIESDVAADAFADFYGPARDRDDTMSPEYMNNWLMRNIEIIDQYHPQLFWFDWWIEQPALEPYRKSLAAYYYNKGQEWGKGVVINYKNSSFEDGTAVYDIERGSSKATKKYPWQTDTSIGKKSWGYIADEDNKSVNEIVDELIDIVSKNGNLLLNIGPKSDGTIDPQQAKVLLGIGDWLKINGEGIYNSRPWKTAGEGPTENPDENVQFNENQFKGYNARDIRFTTNGKNLYVFVLDVPKETILIKSLSDTDKTIHIGKIEMVGSSEVIRSQRRKDGLMIQLPKNMPCDHAVCFRIELKDQ